MAGSAPEKGGPSQGRLYQGVAKTDFGYRMLQTMGWCEGKGLGASGTGITKHLALVKRQDQTGIGADGRSDSTAKVDWTLNTHALDAVLSGLHRHHAKADEPQPAKRRKRDKRGRGDAGSDSEDDVPAPAPAAAPPARGRPQGRYAKPYTDQDLSQILGCIPGGAFSKVAAPPPLPPPVVVAARPPAKDVATPAAADSPALPDAGVSRKRKPPAAPAVPASAPVETPPSAGWWGASTFVWRGCLGSAGEPLSEAHPHQSGFSEADQVDAFNAVTDAAVTGRRGLGVQDLPRKVAGVRFAGTKTVLDSDEDADDMAAEAPAAAQVPAADLSAVKWKKYAARFLKKNASGEAPLSAILHHVLAAAGLADVCRRSAMAALSRRLGRSSQFVVTGEVARLAPASGEDS